MINETKILQCVDIINSRVKPFEGKRKYLDTGGLNIDKIEEVREFDFESKPSRANQNVQVGDIILARMKGTVKVKVISDKESDFMVSTGFLVLRPKENSSYLNFLKHIFLSDSFQRDKDELCTGATQKAINNGNFKKLKVFLPSLETQKKIAAILDEADKLRQLDKKLIEQYDLLTQSLFVDMFGDPVRNPKRWKLKNIRANCEKFCDGPFGSNLKSEHYVMSGVRIVRLQNIGVGVFNDEDKIYIKKVHADTLKNNHCIPGDILIGTMGVPNLRACILPDHIPLAINKADCLICRPEKEVFNTTYLTYLLNNKSFVSSLSDLILGQTRGRISMGRLATRDVIAPSTELQQQFAERVHAIEAQKVQDQQSLKKSEELFNSLLQKAFKGELV
ncbi:restriction endonuclease subunit S [Maribacter chungangensis]|uniref:Restriction endonuclease subunit S n=1 Tax=Maribacter chungangensis TaxID=1069117 RepID=A0ABW3B2X4_9FLAO